jgi:hypothetical protein
MGIPEILQSLFPIVNQELATQNELLASGLQGLELKIGSEQLPVVQINNQAGDGDYSNVFALYAHDSRNYIVHGNSTPFGEEVKSITINPNHFLRRFNLEFADLLIPPQLIPDLLESMTEHIGTSPEETALYIARNIARELSVAAVVEALDLSVGTYGLDFIIQTIDSVSPIRLEIHK